MKFAAAVTSVHRYLNGKTEKYNTVTISCEINKTNDDVHLQDIVFSAPEEQTKFDLDQKMIITIEPA